MRWAPRGAAAFFGIFALFQVALALGAPFGEAAWGGAGGAVLPANLRWASAGAAGYLMLAILVMLARSGDIGRPWMHWSIWMLNFLLTLQLTFNTVANFMSPSPPERWIMGPACAVGCLLCGVSLLAPRRVR